MLPKVAAARKSTLLRRRKRHCAVDTVDRLVFLGVGVQRQ